MAARCTAALWISHEELFMTVAFKIKVDGLVDAITIRKIEYPPPPGLLQSWELARNCPQNPDVKELRGQNLENKGFAHRIIRSMLTAFALTMI